jgi:A-macroglobulin TED domain
MLILLNFCSKKPEGCGEQKMKDFALAIYSYKYMKSSGQFNASALQSAFDAILVGYQTTLGMRTEYGTYNLWSKLHEKSDSVWLTAYVTQLLLEAGSIVENVDVSKSLGYLASMQKYEGYYEDPEGYKFRELQGNSNYRRIHLTAFVVITLASTEHSRSEYQYEISSAIKYLKDSMSQQTYDYEKAITAYAAALAGDHNFAISLISKLTRGFWSFDDQKLRSLHIEVVAYSLLTNLKLNRINDAMRDFSWLIEKRKLDGDFVSTHDTVLAMQAISEFASKVNAEQTSAKISIFSSASNPKHLSTVELSSSRETKYIELSYVRNEGLRIKAQGKGLVYAIVSYQYKFKDQLQEYFDLTVKPHENNDNDLILDVNVKLKRSNPGKIQNTNMAIVEVSLPSGYEYDKAEHSSVVKVNCIISAIYV